MKVLYHPGTSKMYHKVNVMSLFVAVHSNWTVTGLDCSVFAQNQQLFSTREKLSFEENWGQRLMLITDIQYDNKKPQFTVA